MSPEINLPEGAGERRKLGRQIAVDGLVRVALASSAAAARRAPGRRYRRPESAWGWKKRLAAVAAGLISAAAGGLIVLWLHGGAGGLRVESGEVTNGGRATGRLAAGKHYRAGAQGARLVAPGGGKLELAGGASFTPTASGLELANGEVIGRKLSRAELRAGPLRAESAGASLALMRLAENGADEAAVVVFSGRVRADAGRGDAALSAGQALACGWGVEPRVLAVEDLKAALARQRQALAPPGEVAKYHGIVREYAGRLDDFRRQLQSAQAGSPQAGELQSRIDSLADCQAAHERRLVGLDADAAENARIDRRVDFLDRAMRAGPDHALISALDPGHPEGGQVWLSMLSR